MLALKLEDLTNARDAMPGGGVLLITHRSICITDDTASEYSARGGEYAVIEVSDTGKGMSDDVISRIFEPFFTTKRAGSGTGLGMSMIYGLVKQHSGFVQIESELGVGTTVRILLPATDDVAGPSKKRVSRHEVRGGNETILFAEDQASLRRTGKKVLERFGYNVLLAEDGVDALSRFRRANGKIDLVVSDLVMPNMGGKELFDAITDDRPDTKFLIATGHSLKDVVETEHLDPEIPFLEKPWTLESLASRVREVLDS